jgi:PAS domain S-box-containing protein
MKAQPLKEENNADLSDSEKARLATAQLISLDDAENFLKELASVFFPGSSTTQARSASVASELPDVEAGYRTLVEQVPAVVFMAFLDKGIGEAYVSPQIEALLGFSQQEWLNDPVRWYQQIHPDDKARWSVEAAQMFLSGEPLRSVYRVIARAGHVVWFHCEAKMVRRSDGRPWFIHGVAFDITELKHAEQSLREYAERQNILSRRLIEVQEAERRSIALELHDEISQILTGLKLTLEMGARLPADEARASIAQAQVLVNELMGRARNLSLNLRPGMLDDLGLLPALLWHIEHYTSQTKVQVTFKHSGLKERRFAPEVETAAYRIVQEALTNAARHADVKEVTVRVWADQQTLATQIEDRGRGFDPEQALSAGSTSGLAGMHERATLLGGNFSIESHQGAGTRVTAEWDIRNEG